MSSDSKRNLDNPKWTHQAARRRKAAHKGTVLQARIVLRGQGREY